MCILTEMIKREFYWIIALVFIYVGYNMMYGTYGFKRYLHIDDEISSEQAKLSALRMEKYRILNQIHSLRGPNYAADYVDELARDYFGLSEEGEYVIIPEKKH